MLKERIEEIEMSVELDNTFYSGIHSDTLREVYASLLSMIVGVNNVEKVVRTVLTTLSGLKVDRLLTFSEIMLVEAKAIAQMQEAEAMLTSDFNTLHTDGTKRSGHGFGGVQIGTSADQYSLGINEIVRGDTVSFRDLIYSVLSDMAKLLEKNHDINYVSENKSKLILSIENRMTDRHIVNSTIKEFRKNED